MAGENYEQIRAAYNQFVRAWVQGDVELLAQVVAPETACNLSTVEKYPCGGQHGLVGLGNFVAKTPKADFFHIIPCNFVCRIADGMAQQSVVLVCRAGVYEGDGARVIEFSALNVNTWEKGPDGWRIVEFKLDIQECSGDYREFVDGWHFEEQGLKYYFGVHLPVVSGELDAPWTRVPQETEVKDDETQIMEAFSRYAYGIDTLNFTQLIHALSDDLVVNMAPWGAMDKREFMQTLKFKRQVVRYWDHPVTLDAIEVAGDAAFVRLHRMAGHRQSAIPIVFDASNAETVYADARYELKMRREQGEWRVLRLDYFLGTIDLGPFADFDGADGR